MKIRTALVSATTVALAAGVGIGVGYSLGNGDDAVRTGPPSSARDPFVLANSSLELAPDCDSLLDSYVDRGLDLVTAYGWGGGGVVMFDSQMEIAAGSAARSNSASAPVPTTIRSTNNESGTNVQEAGVDEPDVVKVSGDRLFRIQGNVLTTYDVAGDEPEQLSSLQLPDLRNGEILVSGDRVIVLGDLGSRHETTGARIVVIDASRPGTPQVVEETDYTATIGAARLHGDVVRVVLDNGLPMLDFGYPHGNDGERATLERNRELVRNTTLADWLPTTDGEPAVDCEDVALPTMDTALGTTTVVTFESTVVEPTTTAVATTATTSYFSPDRFYLAASGSTSGWWGVASRTIDCIDGCFPGNDGSTELFAFALDGTGTTYVAAGTVEGRIQDRWSMDFADGALRLALGATNETGNFNSVVTMRETDASLTEVGRVDKLGVNEEIKSVRWFDDLAIVVTFRQTDPLYALDLTDPDAPELMGELKIPGYSEYLHPLGARRMIGIGQDATLSGRLRGAQAALFDVTDLTDPRQLDVVTYPKNFMAGAGVDPRQFTWLPDRRTALTVVSQGWTGRTGWVSVLSLDKGRISNRMVEVEYGDDVAEVRLVPLADGRVVLVTGDAVSFFDLS